MSIFDEKPTPEQLQELYKEQEKVWSPFATNCKTNDEYLQGTYEIWEGTDLPELRTPRGYAIVQNAVDAIVSNKPTVDRQPLSGKEKDSDAVSEEEKERNSRVKRFIEAMLTDSIENSASNPLRDLMFNTAGYGRGVGEFKVDTTNKPELQEPNDDFDEKARQHQFKAEMALWNPFRIRAPHPALVYTEPFNKQSRFAFHKRTLRNYEIAELAQTYGSEFEIEGKAFAERGVVEYFTNSWHAMFVSGKNSSESLGSIVFVKENKMGFVPYPSVYSGFGWMPTDNVTSDPSNLAVSLIWPIQGILRAISRALSAGTNSIHLAGFPIPGTNKDVNETQKEIAAGGWVTGPKDTVYYVDPPSMPGYIFTILDYFLKELEAATYAQALTGVKIEGVGTVGQQGMLSTAALRRLENLARQLDYVTSIYAQNALKFVDKIGEPVTIRGQKVTPDDIRGYYAVNVHFKILDPLLQMQQTKLAMDMFDRTIVDDEYIWEIAGIQDSSRMRIATNVQRVRKSQYFDLSMLQALVRDPDVQKGLGQLGVNVSTANVATTVPEMPKNGATPIPQPENQETPGLGQIPLGNAANGMGVS